MPGRAPIAGPRRVAVLLDLCRVLGGHPAPPATGWPAVAALADLHLVGPALWEAVRQVPDLPAEVASQLRERYARNVFAATRLSAQLLEAIAALATAGIRPIALKGAAELLVPDERRRGRVMADLDLLVRPGERQPAVDALGAIGYAARPGPGAARAFESTLTHPAWAAPIDLHTRLGPRAAEEVLPTETVLARTVPVPAAGGEACFILGPADQLAHSVVHSQITDAAHRTAAVPLRQLDNFVALHGRHPLAWPDAVAVLAAAPAVVAAHAALVRRLFRVRIDDPPGTARAQLHVARCLATYAVPHLSDLHANLLWSLDADVLKTQYPASAPGVARVRHVARTMAAGPAHLRRAAFAARNR